MRFYRVADWDTEASLPPVPQIVRLRELVDELPDIERHVVERRFFGGATFNEISEETGVGPKRCRELIDQAVARLGEALRGDDDLGPMFAARWADGPVCVSPDLAGQGPDSGQVLRGEDREGSD